MNKILILLLAFELVSQLVHFSIVEAAEETVATVAEAEREPASSRSLLWIAGKSPGEETRFQDQDLKILLKHSHHGLIYVWSPKMPLSVMGMKQLSEVAKNEGLPITFLLDPTLSAGAYEAALKHSEIPKIQFRKMESVDLYTRGALLHFPSLFFYSGEQIRGRPVLGDRGKQGFTHLLSQMISNEATPLSSRKLASPDVGSTNLPSAGTDITNATPLAIKIRKATELPDTFGYYDKPIFGTRWMGLHIDWEQSYFFNLDTAQLVDLNYTNDTYSTPSDHLYTTYWATPGSEEGGEMGIMETAEFMKIATDSTYRPTALYLDSTLNADYQSVGTLKSMPKYGIYRVITGGYNNYLSYRDYKITHRRNTTAPVVTPLAPTGFLCRKILGVPDQRFGVPVISKDGSLLSAQSAVDQITRIYKIDPSNPENCTLDTTFAAQTSKVAFSYDGKSVAFQVNDDLYIYRRDLKRMFKLTGLTVDPVGAGTPWFPEFREDGSLVVPYTRTADYKMLMVEFSVDKI